MEVVVLEAPTFHCLHATVSWKQANVRLDHKTSTQDKGNNVAWLQLKHIAMHDCSSKSDTWNASFCLPVEIQLEKQCTGHGLFYLPPRSTPPGSTAAQPTCVLSRYNACRHLKAGEELLTRTGCRYWEMYKHYWLIACVQQTHAKCHGCMRNNSLMRSLLCHQSLVRKTQWHLQWAVAQHKATEGSIRLCKTACLLILRLEKALQQGCPVAELDVEPAQ